MGDALPSLDIGDDYEIVRIETGWHHSCALLRDLDTRATCRESAFRLVKSPKGGPRTLSGGQVVPKGKGYQNRIPSLEPRVLLLLLLDPVELP